MKTNRLVVLLLVVAVVAIAAGCTGHAGATETWTVQVTGTDGATFQGDYLYVKDSQPNKENISGTVPAEYSMDCEELTAEVTMTSETGSVTLTLLENGETFDTKTTTTPGENIKIMPKR